MSGSNIIKIGDIPIGGGNPLAFILGPCQLENRDHAMFMAEKISKVCSPSSSNFIFKSSFDKANRSSIASARGDNFRIFCGKYICWSRCHEQICGSAELHCGRDGFGFSTVYVGFGFAGTF